MESLLSSYVSKDAGVDRWVVGTGNSTEAIQFGQTAGVSAAALPDEYSSLLQYTTTGELAAASDGASDMGSDGSFFVTGGAVSGWNNQYTIFGMLTSGTAEQQAIENISSAPPSGYTLNLSGNIQNGNGTDLVSPTITKATLLSSSQATGHVMILSVPSSSTYTGPVTVTVTAVDASGHFATETFEVVIPAPSSSTPTATPPSVPLNNLNGGKGYAEMTGSTTGNATGSFTIPTVSQSGTAAVKYYLASSALSSSTPSYSTSLFSNVTVNQSSGQVTLTANQNAAGLGWVEVLVYDPNAESPSYSTKYIPVYVDPPTLSAGDITLDPNSQDGGAATTGLDNSSSSQDSPSTSAADCPGPP